MKHFIKAVIEWTWKTLLSLVLTVLGAFIIPVGLLTLRKGSRESLWVPAHKAYWHHYVMHPIFWPWDNLRDGAMGDIRLAYWCGKDKPKNTFWHGKYRMMFYWLAIRNPHNNTDRYWILGYDVTNATVEEVLQFGNATLLRAINPLGDITYALDWKGVLWIGNKIHLEHNTAEAQEAIASDPMRAYKGFTIRIGGRD